MRAGPPVRAWFEIGGQRVRRNHVEPARIALRDFGERCHCPVVPLHCNHPARALREQRTGETARPGADLDHGHAVQRTGGARDPPSEIEIEEKILTE